MGFQNLEIVLATEVTEFTKKIFFASTIPQSENKYPQVTLQY